MPLVLGGLGAFGSRCLAWGGGRAARVGAGPSPRPLSCQESRCSCGARGASHRWPKALRGRRRHRLDSPGCAPQVLRSCSRPCAKARLG